MTEQPELPNMPERPPTAPASYVVMVLSVTLQARGMTEHGLVELGMGAVSHAYREVAAAFEAAGAPDDPFRYVKVLATGGGVVARYGEPDAYERAVDRAVRSALAAVVSALRGWQGLEAARPLVGHRVRWLDDQHHGTIVGVRRGRGGYVRLVVQWDEGAPDWWATELSPGAGGLQVDP